jgi:ribosomal protein S6
MFLVDSRGSETAASNGVDSAVEADWDSISAATRKILEKAGAEIVSMKKWDERRLAYEINGKNRGTYILCYFHADGQKIRRIERDAQLSELILRVLILGTEGRSKEDIEKDTCGEVTPDRRQRTDDGRRTIGV